MKPNVDKCKQYSGKEKFPTTHRYKKKNLQKSIDTQWSENHYTHVYSQYYYPLLHLEATGTNKGKIIEVPGSQTL